MRRILSCVLGAGAVAAAALSPACAQDSYPNRPIKIAIPYPAGGLVDTVTRVLGDRLSRALGQQIILESRPGANGSVAAASVARAEPDGYTLMMITEGHAVNPSVFGKLTYDSIKDFTPIGFVGKSPMLLTVHPSIPARTVAEYIKLAKEKPDSLTYGSIGYGSASHLAGEVFRVRAGIATRHVPFRGGAPALNDLLAGHLNSMFITPIIGLQHFQSGALAPLAIAATERFELLPNIPTMAEAGFPLEAAYWFGLVAPAGIPDTAQRKLEAALAQVLAEPETRSRLAQMGAVVTPMNAGEFGKFIASELTTWSKFIQDNNIKAE